MFLASPRQGDWVRSTRRVTVGFVDSLSGGGLPPGTPGVVVSDSVGACSSDVLVEFSSGLGGTVSARVASRHLRVLRRGGGVRAFRRHTNQLWAARLGVATAFLGPLLWFVASYVVTHRGTDGLASALVCSLVYGALDFATFLLEDPVRALVYLAVTSVAWKFAFGR
jgi:hypothetical protein